jgi:hypothetical protein
MNIFSTILDFILHSEVMTLINNLIALLTLFAVGWNWHTRRKEFDQIPIYFNDREINLKIIRRDITRSEIQGILGVLMKDMNQKYKIAYLSKIEFLDKIYQIQKSKLDKLVIEITDEELKQFRDDIYL